MTRLIDVAFTIACGLIAAGAWMLTALLFRDPYAFHPGSLSLVFLTGIIIAWNQALPTLRRKGKWPPRWLRGK